MIKLNKLTTMLILQDKMNSVVNPDWVNAGNDWLLASLMEASEAIDHHGWKWWKKQNPDMSQLQMELIDIWHFQLSHIICMATKEVPTITHEEVSQTVFDMLVDEMAQTESFAIADTYQTNDIVANLKLLIGMNSFGRSPLALFFRILEQSGLTTDDLYQLYIAKNVLNNFRQGHGYKDGTYIKNWHGREDNEVLTEMLPSIDWDSPDIFDDVYKKLVEQYRVVLDTIS